MLKQQTAQTCTYLSVPWRTCVWARHAPSCPRTHSGVYQTCQQWRNTLE